MSGTEERVSAFAEHPPAGTTAGNLRVRGLKKKEGGRRCQSAVVDHRGVYLSDFVSRSRRW